MPALNAIASEVLQHRQVEEWGSSEPDLTKSVLRRGPTEAVRPPSVPPRFRLLDKLGQGGMGVVYRAFDTEQGKEVALKSITVSGPDDLYHLKREFRLLADIQHPNLIRLHELFVSHHGAFFTMDLVVGREFSESACAGVSRGRVRCDYARLRNLGRQLAQGIAAVHAAGKLHRDIKSSNILVTPGDRVVLLDFGLAESLCPKNARTKGAGVLLGTRGFVSPEQARGEPLTTAADWYSFGVTLFEAATGVLPYGDSFKTFLLDYDVERLSHIRNHLPDAPADLDELIAGLLHPIAQRRPGQSEILRVLGEDLLDAVPETIRSSERSDGESEARDATLGLLEQAESEGFRVLRGKCRLPEHVPFNALDEIIDDLSHCLEHMGQEELVAVLPPEMADLASLFPVLGRLKAGYDGPLAAHPAHDGETSRRARGALKDLLTNVAQRRPLLLWIDDAQLADHESRDLLAELLEPPRAPRMVVLLSDCGQGTSGWPRWPRGAAEPFPSRRAAVEAQ
jgi:eukaryotic-like serine/threonine-protein kinase